MSPAAEVFIFMVQEMRIMDQDICILQQGLYFFFIVSWIDIALHVVVTGDRLVVSEIHQRLPTGINFEPQCFARVIESLCRDGKRTNFERAIIAGVKKKSGRQLGKWDRKIIFTEDGVQSLFEGHFESLGAVEVDFGVMLIKRSKKRQATDVIEVKV